MLDPDLIEDFEFDFENLVHLINHGLEAADVWDVFANDPVFVEDLTGGSGDWKMVAPVPGGYLTIVVTEPRSGNPTFARPITGWESEPWEIEEYERHS
jgi:hypothetical protein